MKIKILLTLIALTSATSAFGQVTLTIDFDTDANGNSIAAGTQITNQYAAWGINFQYIKRNGTNPSRSGRELWTFDSNAEINRDDDLETPGDGTVGYGNTTADWQNNGYIFGDNSGAKNILIIQENLPTQANPNPLPDDDAQGGIIRLTFDEPMTFKAVGIVDIDDNPDSFIRFYSDTSATTLIGSQAQIPTTPTRQNNSYQELSFGMPRNIRSIDFDFASSGAISGLQFESNVIPEPSTYALIFGGFALGIVLLKRRLSTQLTD